MNRRDMLIGVVGLAGAHKLSTAAQLMHSPGPTSHDSLHEPEAHALAGTAATTPICLANDELEIVFDALHGLPVSYRYQGQRLLGETEQRPAQAILCRLRPREYRTVPPQVVSSRQLNQTLDFAFRAGLEGRPAAAFHLRYALALRRSARVTRLYLPEVTQGRNSIGRGRDI